MNTNVEIDTLLGSVFIIRPFRPTVGPGLTAVITNTSSTATLQPTISWYDSPYLSVCMPLSSSNQTYFRYFTLGCKVCSTGNGRSLRSLQKTH